MYKLPLLDRTDKLWNNYVMHVRVQGSFDKLGDISGLIEIPRCAWFANETSEFWLKNLKLFPNEQTFQRKARQALCMERIFPLSEPVRHILIGIFCRPENVPQAKSNQANKDCRVRPFLGRKRFGNNRSGGIMFLSLRNYKLHLDQIMELDLEAEQYAQDMAGAMAEIDPMDIEFVLGSSSVDSESVRRVMPPMEDIRELEPGTSTYEYTTDSIPNFKKRLISLWLLDFDACEEIAMDEIGSVKPLGLFWKRILTAQGHSSKTIMPSACGKYFPSDSWKRATKS